MAARFNAEIVDRLIAGAREALREAGAAEADVELFRCPGAMELAGLARRVAETGRFDGHRLSGRGDPGRHAALRSGRGEAARGIGALAAEGRIPVAFGVLACDTLEQALGALGRRIRNENRGYDAAMVAIEMADLYAQRRDRAGPRRWRNEAPERSPDGGPERDGRSPPQIARDRAADPAPDGRWAASRSSTPTEMIARYFAHLAPESAPVADDEQAGDPAARVDLDLVNELVRGVSAYRAEIDAQLTELSRNWRLERMGIVERNVIRIALFELGHAPNVPTAVVINEAVELAKRYGTAEGVAFVNGLLDRAATETGRG